MIKGSSIFPLICIYSKYMLLANYYLPVLVAAQQSKISNWILYIPQSWCFFSVLYQYINFPTPIFQLANIWVLASQNPYVTLKPNFDLIKPKFYFIKPKFGFIKRYGV